MPRELDPDSSSGRLVIHPRNDHERILIQKMKKILRNDGLGADDYFMPIIEKAVARREPSNPQSILTPESSEPISLSQAQREKLGIPEGQAMVFEQEVECQNCHTRHKAQVTCYGKPGEYHE